MNFKASIKQIPKWVRMIQGKSVLTGKQDCGTLYSLHEIAGYYNDLTGKVKGNTLLDKQGIPYNITESGGILQPPVSVIQYGLGLHDLYLQNETKRSVEQLVRILQWVLEHQHVSGGWGVDLLYPEREYYSAMIQGEAISFLLRMKPLFPDRDLDFSIERAYKLLVKPTQENGCACYKQEKLYLMEYPDSSFILNGGIFALWGIYDYVLCTHDEKATQIMNAALTTIVGHLNDFDCGYWSKYDLDKTLASPFYHDLHIAQLKVLSKQFPQLKIGEYAQKWAVYRVKTGNRWRAFIIKAWQKLKSKQSVIIVK